MSHSLVASVAEDFRERVMTIMSGSERVLSGSQSGPGGGSVSLCHAFQQLQSDRESLVPCVAPAPPLSPFASVLPLLPMCRPFDAFGHHHTRGFALESAGASMVQRSRWPSCDQASWCEIWTLQHLIHVTAVGCRMWLSWPPPLREHSLPWTQRSFLHSTVTGLPLQEQLTPMALLWSEQGGAKREPTWSWFSRGRGPDSWCWPVKCLEVGQKRHVGSLGCWHAPGARKEMKLMRRRLARVEAQVVDEVVLRCSRELSLHHLLGMKSGGSDGASPPSDALVHDHRCVGLARACVTLTVFPLKVS